jgi:hypothetical protein
MATKRSNPKNKIRSIKKVAGILQTKPGMVGQVSTGTLQQTLGATDLGSANLAIRGELSKRATSGDYEQVSQNKKRKYR